VNIQEAGIDVRLGELAGLIQETMEPYEVGWQHIHEPLHLMLSSVRPIENLSGHSIKPYRIHGGKSPLLVRNSDPTKMEEGGFFAIETFGSTGRGLAFGFARGHIATLSKRSN
jgi:methionyl aminopeptidase